MGIEARENSAKELATRIPLCREGQVENNGYSLWLHGNIFQREGGTLDNLGISTDEIRTFLVEDLNGWIDNIKQGLRSTEEDYFEYAMIGAYFLPNDNESAFEEGIFDRLGITVEEFEKLGHEIDLRAAKEELARCRTEGVSPKFYGVKINLLLGNIHLDEIGATQSEIDEYTEKYQDTHPFSDFDKIITFQTGKKDLQRRDLQKESE